MSHKARADRTVEISGCDMPRVVVLRRDPVVARFGHSNSSLSGPGTAVDLLVAQRLGRVRRKCDAGPIGIIYCDRR